MQSLPRTLSTVLGLLVVLLVCAPAAAGERHRSPAEAHYSQGMKQYTLGHFPEAIEEFEKAYDLKPEPIFLFNIAQSHRNNKNAERAMFFYRRYLEAEPRAKNRAEVEKRIKEMEKSLAEERERLAPPPVQPVPVAPRPPPPPPVVAPLPLPPEPPPPVAPPTTSAANPGHGLRIAGIVVGSVGLAGIGAGIAFGVYQANLHDQAFRGTFDQTKLNSSNTFETIEFISFGVGGAALATGIVLYIVGASSSGHDQTVSFVPLLAPGMGGIALSGRL